MKKRFFSMLLSLCMVLTLLPSVALADGGEKLLTNDADGNLLCNGVAVNTTSLTIDVQEEGGNAGHFFTESIVGYVLEAGTYKLDSNVTLNAPIIIQGGTADSPVSLDLCGHVLKYENSAKSNSVIVVYNDTYFTLTDSAPTADNGYSYTAGPDAGDFTLYTPGMEGAGTTAITGGIITGGTGTAIDCVDYYEYDGGGVFVGCRANFTMTGGSIVGCTLKGSISCGGGVFVAQGNSSAQPVYTTFTMTGGSIIGCTADTGGGVCVRDGSKFTMTDSSMIGCTANSGGGIHNKGTVYMKDSTVSKCAAVGWGGGVNISADFVMENSFITDCIALRGGGVCAEYNRDLVMKNGSIISGCVATADFTYLGDGGGGGIYVYCSSFTMEEGSAIFDCTAKPDCGNSIYVFSDVLDAKGGSVNGVAVVKDTIKNTAMSGSALFYDGVEKNKNGKGYIIGKLVTFMDGDTMYAQTLAGTTQNQDVYTCGGGKITLPTLTKDGYRFTGWYKDSACTDKWDPNKTDGENDASFNVTGRYLSYDYGTYTLYAGWTHVDHTGGTATCQAMAECETCGEPYGVLDLTNHVGTLGEWQKDGNGHWKTYSCCPTVKGAESAHSFGEDGKCECGAVQYTITFDPNGGTVDPTSATTDAYGKLTELPTPTRSGSYRFDGWFTEKNGGTAVTVDTIYEAHTTVYAHWTYTGSTTPDYCVIKAAAGEGGSITPSGRAAVLYGASKTFTITPNDGYAIADVKVDGKSVGAVKTYTFERVRGDHTIEAVFMKATGNPQTGVDVPFTDVSENDWFYEDVAYVYANDLMKGTSETTFSPAVTTTRGMIVTILYRLEGEPTVSDNCPFEDVKSGSYYEKAITWAAANEIVGGYGNGKFGPDDPITREQMAVILYRYTQYKGMDVSVGEDTNILSYNDAQEISEYAFSAMQWACGESILNGSDGNLMPQGNATRAQVAAILHRFCENILK